LKLALISLHDLLVHRLLSFLFLLLILLQLLLDHSLLLLKVSILIDLSTLVHSAGVDGQGHWADVLAILRLILILYILQLQIIIVACQLCVKELPSSLELGLRLATLSSLV